MSVLALTVPKLPLKTQVTLNNSSSSSSRCSPLRQCRLLRVALRTTTTTTISNCSWAITKICRTYRLLLRIIIWSSTAHSNNNNRTIARVQAIRELVPWAAARMARHQHLFSNHSSNRCLLCSQWTCNLKWICVEHPTINSLSKQSKTIMHPSFLTSDKFTL